MNTFIETTIHIIIMFLVLIFAVAFVWAGIEIFKHRRETNLRNKHQYLWDLVCESYPDANHCMHLSMYEQFCYEEDLEPNFDLIKHH